MLEMSNRVYARPFERYEYEIRLANVRRRMAENGLDLLVCTDPSNMNYLSGYDGWSFHTPQCLLVHISDGEPVWIGRGVDKFGAQLTSILPETNIEPYPDRYFVVSGGLHPFDYVCEVISSRGWSNLVVGLEMETYGLSARCLQILVSTLPNATFKNAQWLVDRVRAIKSPAEIEIMDQAARILDCAMDVAFNAIRPGVRQCDAAAEIMAAQIRGANGYYGDYPSVVPLMPTGKGTSAPHLTWSEREFRTGEATIVEIAGCRSRYHVPMGRTLFLGTPTPKMLDATKYALDGIAAALDMARPGVECEQVELAWRKGIAGSGFEKESRVGYCIGMGYPPDWCGNTMSFYPGDHTILEEGMTFHMMPGVWMEDWGIEVSEPIHITSSGARLLARVERNLIVRN